MNKNEFLQELGAFLAILDGKEQQDILAEYSQHIDMKIANGLSEAETIKDFGDIRDLAGEILEAYHVNPDYKAAGERGGRMDGRRAAEKGLGLWQPVKRFLKKAGESIGHFFAVCLDRGAYIARKTWGFIRRPWMGTDGIRSWRRKKPGFQSGEAGYAAEGYRKTEYTDAEYMDAEPAKRGHAGEYAGGNGAGPGYTGKTVNHRLRLSRQTPGRKHPILAGISTYPGRICRLAGSFTGYLFSLCLHTALWCIRWAWNICMMFLAFFSGLFTLLAVFGFGVAVVWLAQGYPLAGVSIMGLGTILCGGSFTFLCVSLIRLKGKRERAAGQGQHRTADGQRGGGRDEGYTQIHGTWDINHTSDGSGRAEGSDSGGEYRAGDGGYTGEGDRAGDGGYAGEDDRDSRSPDGSSGRSTGAVVKEVQHA